MTERGDTMTIIDFILGIASPPPARYAASRPGEGGCNAGSDPSTLVESLAVPRQWTTGADLADAYQSSCARSEEHSSELQSLMRLSYAVFCLKNKRNVPIQIIS